MSAPNFFKELLAETEQPRAEAALAQLPLWKQATKHGFWDLEFIRLNFK
jgi:hypothetical protein